MIDLSDEEVRRYDLAVDATEGIDRWCSSSDWVLPLGESMGPGDPFVVRTADGWGLFDRSELLDGSPVVLGLDRVWGFACPVIGTGDVWRQVAAELAERPWGRLLIQGLVEDRDPWHACIDAFGPMADLFRAGGIARQQADLSDGVHVWMARRSSRFRQSLRRARREATTAGVTIDEVDPATDADDLMVRLQAIEETTWKGPGQEGLANPGFADFYRRILRRTSPRGATRALVAQHAGRDVAFILGAVRGEVYRGFQLSQAVDVTRLSLGHVLQAEQMERLAAEGVPTYDLGMDIPYKRRWADHQLETTVVAVVRRGAA